ncbi:Myb-like DNA-binding domain-containing protein [Endozoicomonas sp.]|uniref:Myb-like DNA-binding domain-containing protein n=1 Tax=Endozoicomonas sp. TaxID=1892382 RepID=UPI002887D8B1|nr:Myb-like DNA-binding domain-containing protein [Endozoicomonas sp.]
MSELNGTGLDTTNTPIPTTVDEMSMPDNSDLNSYRVSIIDNKAQTSSVHSQRQSSQADHRSVSNFTQKTGLGYQKIQPETSHSKGNGALCNIQTHDLSNIAFNDSQYNFSEGKESCGKKNNKIRRKTEPVDQGISRLMSSGKVKKAVLNWTKGEDELLLELVGEHGTKWTTIAERFTYRTNKNCREHWLNHFSPGVKKGNWTAAEDQRIVILQQKYGNHWTAIAGLMPGRTSIAIKNHWNSTLRGQSTRGNTPLEQAHEHQLPEIEVAQKPPDSIQASCSLEKSREESGTGNVQYTSSIITFNQAGGAEEGCSIWPAPTSTDGQADDGDCMDVRQRLSQADDSRGSLSCPEELVVNSPKYSIADVSMPLLNFDDYDFSNCWEDLENCSLLKPFLTDSGDQFGWDFLYE